MPSDSLSISSGQGAEIMKGFPAAYPGLSIEPVVQGDIQKFKTQVAGGVPPDMFHTQSYLQTTWGATKIVQPLDGYVAKSKNIKPADVWTYKWNEVVWKGKPYAIPYSIDNRVVFVNDDLYRRAGLDPTKPPASWTDMEAAVSKTVQMAGTQVKQVGWDPFSGSGGAYTWLVPFWQLGGDFAPGDGSKVDIANDMGVSSLEWVSKIYDMQGGYDAIQAYTKATLSGQKVSYSNGVALFSQGRAAHVYDTINTKAVVFDQVQNLSYHLAQYPLPPNGKVATYAGGWAMCIGTGAKNPDGGFAVMDYLYQPDIQIKWAAWQLRVPPSMSVAQSVDYTHNDPLLKLTVEAMPNGHFVPSVPGGEQILPILGKMLSDVMAKKVTPNAGLADAQRLCQIEVDKYR
jgi:multiple sugar transport system substrate-binding protein